MKPQRTESARTALLSKLTKRLADNEESLRHQFLHKAGRFEGFLNEEDLARACSTMASMAVLEIQLMVSEVLRSGWTEEASSRLEKALTRAILCASVYESAAYPYVDTDEMVADSALSAIELTHWVCFALAGLERWDEAERLARHLLKFHEADSIVFPSKEDDIECRNLLRFLVQALAHGAWQDAASLELGPYKALMAARLDSRDAWCAALMDVADFRMARHAGYPDAGGTKAIALSQRGLYLFENSNFAAWPADLWAIQALIRRLDGIELGLVESSHPWLASPLIKIPSRQAGEADEFSLQLKALATRLLPM